MVNSVSYLIDLRDQDERAVLRLCTLTDLPALYAFQLETYMIGEDRSTYCPLQQDEWQAILTEYGEVWALYDADKMIGFRVFYFPMDKPDNLGRDLNLNVYEQMKVMHLEACMVHPAYRGQRLHVRMTRAALKLSTRAASFRYICATVDPANQPSLRNLQELGLRSYGLRSKYNGRQRYMMMLDRMQERT
ncbi:GNAT family N-acetyltransferase [Marinicrinis sediminis]|uniref:GNAT family N-acetyltransferase n=1 Tax=Marinicrinis sediminis TaxID=1652465 RepID=A0ABW5RFD8_9BACL